MSARALLDRLRRSARAIRRDVVALSLAARDPRTPWAAKVVAACVVAYALSPIDLIPDFIPVLGQIDDLIVVPLGLLLAVRLTPRGLMAELRAEAQTRAARPTSRAGAIAAIAVGAIWLAVVVVVLWLAAPARLHA